MNQHDIMVGLNSLLHGNRRVFNRLNNALVVLTKAVERGNPDQLSTHHHGAQLRHANGIQNPLPPTHPTADRSHLR